MFFNKSIHYNCIPKPCEEVYKEFSRLIYGTLLTRDFVGTPTMQIDPARHLQHLRATVGSLMSTPPSHHGYSLNTVPLGLMQSKYVFIRHDTALHCKSCTRVPVHRVLESGAKTLLSGFMRPTRQNLINRHLDIDKSWTSQSR